jgi:hypothetical protein
MDCKVKLFRVAATSRLGICRHQRPVPRFRRRCPRPLPRPLENRAIPPRGQANARDREMQVLLRPRPEKPHRLPDTRLALPDKAHQKVENEYGSNWVLRTWHWLQQPVQKRSQQCPATPPDVVHELKEPQVDRQLFLGNATMRAQPGAQQRPETLHRVERTQRKTRYGWAASPCPTGTFTLQETLSLSQRDNARAKRRCGKAPLPRRGSSHAGNPDVARTVGETAPTGPGSGRPARPAGLLVPGRRLGRIFGGTRQEKKGTIECR